MIDTVCLQSPIIEENVARIIEKEALIRQGLDLRSGEIIYQITTSELKGSYDSRLRIKVEREKWTSYFDERVGRTITYKKPSEPYLIIEGSVHKLMLGHNCYGGSDDFKEVVTWLIRFIERSFGCVLPNVNDWIVRRIDKAEVFDLGSYDVVKEWFRGINNAEYSRRKAHKYGLSGIMFPGSTTVVKFYHKGVEFVKHDRKRLKKILSDDKIENIQRIADRLLRVEVEIRSRKLKNDFGIVRVKDITNEYLNSVYDKEVKKVLKEGESEMKIIRTAVEVERRLYSCCNSSLAGALLGTWYRLATLGEEYTKEQMSRATFYRHRKLLKELGISWHDTDVVLMNNSIVPVDFTPLRNDVRRLIDIDKKVLSLLANVS